MHQSSNKIPGKEIVLQFPIPIPIQNGNELINHVKIPLFVDMNAGIGGDVWPAATLFGNLLTQSVDLHTVFSQIFIGKSVIELGSGNGLVSILIEKLFPGVDSIAVSDIDDHLALMKHNLDLNRCQKCYVESVNWFDYSSNNIAANSERKTYDVILALECVYKEELFYPLISTMKALSHSNTTVIMGMTKSFTSPSFFNLLNENNISYQKIPFEMIQRIFAGKSDLYSNIEDLRNIGVFLLRFES